MISLFKKTANLYRKCKTWCYYVLKFIKATVTLAILGGIAFLGITILNGTDVMYDLREQNIANSVRFHEARVTRVIDGDTFVLTTGERVRLIGVNTPERDEQGFDEATAFTSDLILNATVWLESDGDNVDRHGRLRRYVWLQYPDDRTDPDQIRTFMLNALLLEHGYARVMIVGSPRNAELFREIAEGR